MKFALDYKYRHIPFCSHCAAHTKFTPVQNNRVVGAMTFDNPNSNIDPTLVATRTETKLVCNTCGSEMFKWSEKESATDEYFKQFYNQEELRNEIGDAHGWGCLLSIIVGLIVGLGFPNFYAAISGEKLKSPDGPFVFLLITVPLAFFFFIVNPILNKRNNEKVHNKIITLGKGAHGEAVIFHQESGQIEYK